MSRLTERTAATIALVATIALLLISLPGTAIAKPVFKAPFPCNQTWTASTYNGHGHGNNAVDFNRYPGQSDFGQPALASAAGTAVSYWDSYGGGNVVRIDHGGGWSTVYAHLDTVDIKNPITVGEKIGTVGGSGSASSAPHLHYEQRLNGQAQPVMLEGVRISVGRSYTASDPTVTSKNCPSTTKAFSAPTPVVAGTLVNGKTLTANHGTWTPTPSTRTYQWLRSGTAIKGATAKTYTLTDADVGKTMSVKVTGKKTGYTTLTKTSKATAAVKGKALTAAPTPTITGQTEVDQTVAASPGTWGPAPVSLSYQWLRDGATINGATASTYTLVQADIGKAISVKVTGKKTGYVSQTKTSAARTVTAQTITTGTPTIAGTPRIDETLTAAPGAWGPEPVNLTYQWKRDGAAIPGATAPTHTLVGADVGRVITVAVTGSKNGHKRTTTESAATEPVVADSLTGTPTPTVSGSPVFDSVLTADAGTWGPAPVELSHQWLRNGTPIGGATAPTYRLTAADVGTTVTVTVTGRKPGYVPVARTSTPTAKIAAKTLTAPTPTISGTARQSAKLTANPGAWTAGTKLAYQWRRDGAAIGGATGSTYTPVERDIGRRLTVTVTGSKAGHTTVAKTSTTTAVVTSAKGDRLTRGKRLDNNTSLYSPNGRYKLTQQSDGNLVLRNIAGSSPRVIWATNTHGRGVAYVVMQNDGNLVQYTKGGAAIWSTKTNGKGGDRVVVQNDGNTVIYTAGGKVVWATNTNGK